MQQLLFGLGLVLCACTLLVQSATTIFDFHAVTIDGEEISLSKYQSAKAILIVNGASQCGYTYVNYHELSEMYDRLHDKGLEILGKQSLQLCAVVVF